MDKAKRVLKGIIKVVNHKVTVRIEICAIFAVLIVLFSPELSAEKRKFESAGLETVQAKIRSRGNNTRPEREGELEEAALESPPASEEVVVQQAPSAPEPPQTASNGDSLAAPKPGASSKKGNTTTKGNTTKPSTRNNNNSRSNTSKPSSQNDPDEPKNNVFTPGVESMGEAVSLKTKGQLRTDYCVGSDIIVSDTVQVFAVLSNGEERELSADEYTVSDVDTSSSAQYGTRELTVSYEGVSARLKYGVSRYEVILDMNNGTLNGLSSDTVEVLNYTIDLTSIGKPVKLNQEFTGWYPNPQCNAQERIAESFTVTMGNISTRLYAGWADIGEGGFVVSEDGYAVSYQGNAGIFDEGILSLPKKNCSALAAGAFETNFEGIQTLEIPANITEIEPGALKELKDLRNIFVDSANPSYCDINGVLYTKDKKTLVAYPSNSQIKGSGNGYTIETGTLRIEPFAFYGAMLTKVDARGCTDLWIGASAFEMAGGQGTFEVELPAGVSTIEERAFWTNIDKITFIGLEPPLLMDTSKDGEYNCFINAMEQQIKIYVPQTAYDSYTSAFSAYSYKGTPLSENIQTK